MGEKQKEKWDSVQVNRVGEMEILRRQLHAHHSLNGSIIKLNGKIENGGGEEHSWRENVKHHARNDKLRAVAGVRRAIDGRPNANLSIHRREQGIR